MRCEIATDLLTDGIVRQYETSSCTYHCCCRRSDFLFEPQRLRRKRTVRFEHLPGLHESTRHGTARSHRSACEPLQQAGVCNTTRRTRGPLLLLSKSFGDPRRILPQSRRLVVRPMVLNALKQDSKADPLAVIAKFSPTFRTRAALRGSSVSLLVGFPAIKGAPRGATVLVRCRTACAYTLKRGRRSTGQDATRHVGRARVGSTVWSGALPSNDIRREEKHQCVDSQPAHLIEG
jgi:hypothetical protein